MTIERRLERFGCFELCASIRKHGLRTIPIPCLDLVEETLPHRLVSCECRLVCLQEFPVGFVRDIVPFIGCEMSVDTLVHLGYFLRCRRARGVIRSYQISISQSAQIADVILGVGELFGAGNNIGLDKLEALLRLTDPPKTEGPHHNQSKERDTQRKYEPFSDSHNESEIVEFLMAAIVWTPFLFTACCNE